jgi:hypothetical protein
MHASAANGEAATATLKLACHACSLMRVPPRTSTLKKSSRNALS